MLHAVSVVVVLEAVPVKHLWISDLQRADHSRTFVSAGNKT